VENDLVTVGVSAVLAVAGALARQLNLQNAHDFSVILFISGCFVGGFTGVMIHFLANAGGLDNNFHYLAAGIAGWIGPQILDSIGKIATKKLGLDEDKKKDD
jgi:hypothetical protein